MAGLVRATRDALADYDPKRVEAERWVGDDTISALGEAVLLGLYVAEQYGGQGLSQTGYCRVMQEFSAVDGSLSVVMGVHQSIGLSRSTCSARKSRRNGSCRIWPRGESWPRSP